jgi:FAD-dependent urate hydroxylase
LDSSQTKTMSTSRKTKTCVIGAGPYGISIAAHLRSAGNDVRVFGVPMRRWRYQMPKGNFLKSEGCASSLSEPTGLRTLTRYCSAAGMINVDYGEPVSREAFVDYALSFQRDLVPNVEEVVVDRLEHSADGYELQLGSGELVRAENVVVATGMDYMSSIPRELAELPSGMRSHSSDHSDFSSFRGMDVAVVGGGQSALETAAELHEAGAKVQMLVRRPSLDWNPRAVRAPRSLSQRLRWPRTRLGHGLQLWLYDNAPGLFHRLPLRLRINRLAHVLGPAGAWWLHDRVVGELPVLFGRRVEAARAKGSRVALQIGDAEGRTAGINVDHVFAATGYRYDLDRLGFLGRGLKEGLRRENRQPVLTANLESSAPGLYFTGLASTCSFGPVMRFIAGTHFTASRICGRLAPRQKAYAASRPRAEVCPEF